MRTLGNKLCKLADNTYLIIPADNADSRSAEIDNIETWARTNNLTLNQTKSKEIVVVDTKRKRQVVSYPSLPGIVRVTSLKALGVIVTNGLLASDHVRGVIANCAQTLCIESLARPRHVLFGAADHLPVGHCSQVAVCFQCLVGLHQCDRPAASQCVLAPQYSLRPMST